MRNKRWICLIFFLSAVLLATGCAGKRELNELALVMAVGIDKGEKKSIRVTVQVARPADARGQTGAPSGNTGDAIWSAFGEGETIFEAIRDLSSFSSRRIFWAHNVIIVINEDLAKEGIRDIIDFFTRNPELRMRTGVVVTPDKASEIVTTLTGLEVLPAEAIEKLFRFNEVSGKAPRTEMLDLEAAYLSDSTEPVLGRLKLIKKGVSNKKPGAKPITQIELAGAGVFKGDRLAGTLSGKETKGLLPFVESVKSSELVVGCTPQKGKVSLELANHRFNVEPFYKNGKPGFNISYKMDANVVEADCAFSLKKMEQAAEVKKRADKKVEAIIRNVTDKAQKDFKSDFLELGKVFQNKFPAEWDSLKGRWAEEFPKARIHIKVDIKLNDSVLLYQSTKSGKKMNK